MKLNQFIKSSTHLSGHNVFYMLLFMAFILLRLICISTYIIVIYSFFFFYTSKGEERENRVTVYSCCYHYCLLIQDQSVIVRRSVHSFNSITLLSLSSCCRFHSHTAYATILNRCVHEWPTCIKHVYFCEKMLNELITNLVFVWPNVLTYDFYYSRLPPPTPTPSLTVAQFKRKRNKPNVG